MTTQPFDARSVLDAYLDGTLDAAARTSFELQLDQDPLLRAEVERQRRVDSSIRRLFEPPSSEKLVEAIRAAAEQMPVRRKSTRLFGLPRRLAIAAMIALAAVGAWLNRERFWPSGMPGIYTPQPWRPLTEAYEFELERGMKPDWVCRDDVEFARTFRRAFRQPLLLAAAPPGISAGGLCYRNVITPSTVAVLGQAYGQPVMVFVDRLDRDTRPGLPDGSTLNLYRRELGRVVLYELSPLDRPYLLDLFYDPDAENPRD